MQCIIKEKQFNQLAHYDETKEMTRNSEIVRVKENLKYKLNMGRVYSSFHNIVMRGENKSNLEKTTLRKKKELKIVKIANLV